jgi:hypothetical protein
MPRFTDNIRKRGQNKSCSKSYAAFINQRQLPRQPYIQVHQSEWQVPSRHVILLRQRGGKLVGETGSGHR